MLEKAQPIMKVSQEEMFAEGKFWFGQRTRNTGYNRGSFSGFYWD